MKYSGLDRLRAVKPWWLVTAGLAVLAISGWLWWSQIYQDPSRVFWGMVSQSLQTSAVSRQTSQSGQGLSLLQTMIMQYGADNSILNKTTLKQSATTIVTEQIGLPDKEYIQYTTITSNQKTPAGKPADFSKVLHKWAKTDYNPADSQQSPSLFAQSSLGIAGGNLIPIANLSQRDHDSLVRLMHDGQVFDLRLSKLQRQTVDGRPEYKYTIGINAVAYAALQKTLARMIGTTMLDSLDPQQYKDQPVTDAEITVDVWSHQLRQVKVANQPRTETYSSYGVGRSVTEPKTTINGQQLQDMVSRIK